MKIEEDALFHILNFFKRSIFLSSSSSSEIGCLFIKKKIVLQMKMVNIIMDDDDDDDNSQVKKEYQEEEEDEPASSPPPPPPPPPPSIHGDILESILSNVPLVHLAASASLVSTEWRLAVSSSLRHLNPPKPWFFLHTQATRTPYSTSTRAYDTRSHAWMQFPRPSFTHLSTLRSSHSALLYMISPSRLAFSSDPFHLTWHHADSPFVWRPDPIVALVGTKLIVAGGGCDFEDDPLAVEIYDVNTQTWDSCELMPAVLKDSAASTWLSVATDGRLMFVVERQSGVMHTFDPESNMWSGPFDIRPDETVFCSIITYSSGLGRLVLIGLIGGEGENAEGLKMWSVDAESLEREEIGEMPKEFIEKTKRGRENWLKMSSISACSAANWVYIHNNNPNPSSPMEEMYVCELLRKGGGGGCRWKREEIPVEKEKEKEKENPAAERVVFTCSEVSFPDVKEALRSTRWKCPTSTV